MTPASRRVLALALAVLPLQACAAQPTSSVEQPAAPGTAAAEPLFPARFGSAEVPARAPGAIRVATYNVENLFDDVDDPALSGDHEDIDDRKPDAQLDAVAKAIRDIDADIVCLQEVESEAALRWFMDARLSDMGYTHVVSIDAGDERGIEQAVLSRFPIVETLNWPRRELGGVHPEKYGNAENWYAGEPIVFHRSPLMAVVEVPGEAWGGDHPWRLRVFAVHFKSGRYSDYWRDKESAGLLAVIEEIGASGAALGPTLILGDFNALPSDDSVRALTDSGFHDLFADNPGPKSRWITHESGRRIDMILASDDAAALASEASETVYGTPARPAEISWRDLDTFPGYASDHYPVMVDLIPSHAAAGATTHTGD